MFSDHNISIVILVRGQNDIFSTHKCVDLKVCFKSVVCFCCSITTF